MEEKDYIIVNTENEGSKKAELVLKFEVKNMGEFVIYKLDNKYYGAKYIIDSNETILITDLDDKEKEVLNEAFKKLGVE